MPNDNISLEGLETIKVSVPFKDKKEVQALNDQVLLDDHRFMHAFWANLKAGKDLKDWSLELVEQSHAWIVEEMLVRFFFPTTSAELEQTPKTVEVITAWLKKGLLDAIASAALEELLKAHNFVHAAHQNLSIPIGVIIAAHDVLVTEIQDYWPDWEHDSPIVESSKSKDWESSVDNCGSEKSEGDALEDYEYLIHHVVVGEDGKENLHHCFLFDHIGNLFEHDHLIVKDGEIRIVGKKITDGVFHIIKGLESGQDVAWSDEEATERGIVPKKMRAGMTAKEKAEEW